MKELPNKLCHCLTGYPALETLALDLILGSEDSWNQLADTRAVLGVLFAMQPLHLVLLNIGLHGHT